MPLRIVEISAPDTQHAAIKKLAEKHEAIDYWYSAKNKDGRRSTQILVHLNHQQALMDDLQKEMHKEDHWRLIVLPVRSTLPEHKISEAESDKNQKVRALPSHGKPFIMKSSKTPKPIRISSCLFSCPQLCAP